MDWREIYRQKLVSVEDAAKVIKSNDRVFAMAASGLPYELLKEIDKRRNELENVTVMSGIVLYPYEFFKPGNQGGIRYTSVFMGPFERMGCSQGVVDVFAYQFGKIDYTTRNVFNGNVFCIEVSPPDENGDMSFGVMGTLCGKIAVEYADTVIVSVNRRTPYVYGPKEAFVNVSDVDCICEHDHEIPELPDAPITDIDRRIAHHIVSRIDDGATIQIGIGGLGNAVGFFLEGHKDLGIHTEMLVDSMINLAEKGVVNGKRKTLHPNEIIFSFGLGKKKLYDFVHKNDAVKAHPIDYVGNPYTIGQNKNFVSINNALMCDLTGQVCSESVGYRQFSATGGQLDFVRGAQLSPGGQSFIALESTTKQKDGTLLSRITCALPSGAVVTTPRTDVHYVVTEHGIADLKCRSIKDRIREMIRVAHPQFREQLEKEARENHLYAS